MQPKTLGIRLLLVVLLVTCTSLLGGISASWWAAALLGFLGAIVFTMISERLLRRMVWGKIGRSLLSVYTVQLLGETASIALLAVAASALGIVIVNATVFWVAAGFLWLVLCHEMFNSIRFQIWLYLAMSRR